MNKPQTTTLEPSGGLQNPERREVLKLLLGGISVVPFAVAGGAVQKVVDGVTGVLEEKIELILDAEYSDIVTGLVEKYMTEERELNYKACFRNAQEVVKSTGETKFEYAKRQLHESALPEELSDLFLFAGFEESCGFVSDKVSDAGAEGPWQFMPETGEKYGLKSTEDRRDMEKSTAATIKYCEDSWNKLRNNANWKFLKQKLDLDDSELVPFVVSSFNAGEDHMLHLFEMLVEDSKEHEIAKSLSEKGKYGLFSYMYKEYAPRYKELQRGRPKKENYYKFENKYYRNQSRAYVYKIMAYQAFHEQINPTTKREEVKDAEESNLSCPVSAGWGSIGALGLTTVYLAALNSKKVWEILSNKQGIKKIMAAPAAISRPSSFTRRDYLKTVLKALVFGGVGGVIAKNISWTPQKIEQITQFLDNIVSELPEDELNPFVKKMYEFMEDDVPEDQVAIDPNSDEIRLVFASAKLYLRDSRDQIKLRFDRPKLERERRHGYAYNHAMGKFAFAETKALIEKGEFNDKKIVTYLNIADHFYNRALEGSQKAKDNSDKPAEIKLLDAQIKFCKGALFDIKVMRAAHKSLRKRKNKEL